MACVVLFGAQRPKPLLISQRRPAKREACIIRAGSKPASFACSLAKLLLVAAAFIPVPAGAADLRAFTSHLGISSTAPFPVIGRMPRLRHLPTDRTAFSELSNFGSSPEELEGFPVY